MRRIAEGIALAHRMELEFSYRRVCPPLVNHKAETAHARHAVEFVAGACNVWQRGLRANTAAEDFARCSCSSKAKEITITRARADRRGRAPIRMAVSCCTT